jgi:acyl-CoA synthetase (AMP-forming)/AMP-acid ligase II
VTDDLAARVAAVTAELMGPGAPYEIAEEDVLGERMAVFAQRPRSLREVLAASVAEHADAEHLVFGDRRITYGEFGRAVASVAAALRDRHGVAKGDRVAILAANCPEWLVTFWAAVSLGAVSVGLNGWWAGDEIRYGVADCDPAVLVADRKRLDRVAGGDDLGVPIVVIEDDFPALWSYAPGGVQPGLPDTPIDEDDPAVILYTSGTTGRPKGAVQSHRNVLALVMVSQLNVERGRRLAPPPPGGLPGRNKPFITYPMFHVSGLHNSAVCGLAAGSTIVYHVGRFDPAAVLASIEAERCTAFSIVATTAWRIVNHPDALTRDLSSVIQTGGGAAPISGALQQRLREIFPNAAARMGIGYGMTETTSLATTAGAADLLANPDSVGRAIPTTQVEIRDPEGRVVPEGVEGEIHVRSPLVMLGYWRNPEATAAAIGEGRWLRTGDIGHMVGDQLVLSSRRKDLILRGAENVYPAEIENVLEAHPDVREAVVVGVAHEELGQEVKAIVVPEHVGEGPDAGLDVDALRAYVAERLAYFKVPSRWEVRTDPLPRNATGKVLRDVALGKADNAFVEE